MEINNIEDKDKNMISQREPNFPQQMNYFGPLNIIPQQSSNNFKSEMSLQNNTVYPNLSQENQEQIQDSEKSKENSDETDEKKNQKTLKRRSKSEVEGRNHICKLCNKSYLSYPALYTHYKLKHNTNNSSGRGRGRPKKEQNENEVEKTRYNPVNLTFFSKEDRTGTVEPSKINECADIAFNELYSEEYKKRNELREMKYYENINEHPFLNEFKEDKHDINKNVIDEHVKADSVLIEYLNKMSMFCNTQYYIKLIKFVTLFREHVNIFNAKNDKNQYGENEYTKIKDAEDVPDCSNEFITDFLHPEGNETDFGFTKDESIDLTQNLCYWMYENNFTCSKLSLINNEK